jgi:molecular chaperone GrpE
MEENNNQNEAGIPKNELEECQQKCQEYLNNWKRSAADFINYKKEEMERIGTLAKYAKEDTIYKILPIVDNIYLAEKQIPESLKNDEWVKGFMQIQKQAEEFLKKEGIEEIETVGKPFDPNTMEIVQEVEGGESGMVAEELQKGYMMEGKILRPAKVKMSK